MGGWATAQSQILLTTITLERLLKRGYHAMLTYYKKVAPHLNEPLYTRTALFRLSLTKCTVVREVVDEPAEVRLLSLLKYALRQLITCGAGTPLGTGFISVIDLLLTFSIQDKKQWLLIFLFHIHI